MEFEILISEDEIRKQKKAEIRHRYRRSEKYREVRRRYLLKKKGRKMLAPDGTLLQQPLPLDRILRKRELSRLSYERRKEKIHELQVQAIEEAVASKPAPQRDDSDIAQFLEDMKRFCILVTDNRHNGIKTKLTDVEWFKFKVVHLPRADNSNACSKCLGTHLLRTPIGNRCTAESEEAWSESKFNCVRVRDVPNSIFWPVEI